MCPAPTQDIKESPEIQRFQSQVMGKLLLTQQKQTLVYPSLTGQLLNFLIGLGKHPHMSGDTMSTIFGEQSYVVIPGPVDNAYIGWLVVCWAESLKPQD